uniref:Uncharacterized protein n=1 Tax=Arundo donax TaxID=35708 RepID=A0A0A9DWE3_ARUDO
MTDGPPGGKCFNRNGQPPRYKPSTVLSYTDSFLMNLFTIAYARASIKKGPNSIIDQRGNLPTEFLPRIRGRSTTLWDAKVTIQATKLVARKGNTTIQNWWLGKGTQQLSCPSPTN